MALVMKEYVGFNVKKNNENSFNESYDNINFNNIDPSSNMVLVEAMHSNIGTRNFTRYKECALRSSIPTWTKPYLRPVILHHNDYDGKIIGRVMNASVEDSIIVNGENALALTLNVSDDNSKKAVKDSRLLTLSIGTMLKDVRCSICGKHLEDGDFCEHERGETYDGQICYWDVYDMEAKEISYVIVPSDPYAQNIKIFEASMGTIGAIESNNINKATKIGGLEMDKDNKKDGQEPTNTADENIIKKYEAELKTEKELRESVEKDFDEYKNSTKSILVSVVESYRSILKKPVIAKESLQERSVDSLGDAIVDLVADFTESFKKDGVDSKEAEAQKELEEKEAEEKKKLEEAEAQKKLEEKEAAEKLKNVEKLKDPTLHQNESEENNTSKKDLDFDEEIKKFKKLFEKESGI